MLTVNEIFYSIQGESTRAGRPCVFVRLTACDLRCSWCDTPYSFHEGRKRTVDDVVAEVERQLEVPPAVPVHELYPQAVVLVGVARVNPAGPRRQSVEIAERGGDGVEDDVKPMRWARARLCVAQRLHRRALHFSVQRTVGLAGLDRHRQREHLHA